MTLLFSILLILGAYFIFTLLRLVYKRASAILRLVSLAKKEKKIKLRFNRSPMLFLFKMSHAPDLVIEIDNKIFLVRFYNGRGPRSQVHFANEEYSAVFSILMVRSMLSSRAAPQQFGLQGRAAQSITTIRRRVRIVPALEVPEEYRGCEDKGKRIIPVFVFNPAPANVSYVSDEKTSIKLAFTGDDFRGTKIFTASTFLRFIDRETRYDTSLRRGYYDEN